MQITETERINYIIQKGKKNSIDLKEFIKIQIAEFENSEEYKEMICGLQYAQNENEIKNKKRYWTDSKGIRRTTKKLANNQLRHPIPRKMKLQKQGYLLKKKMTMKQVLDKDENENTEYMKQIKAIFNNRMHKMMKRTLGGAIDTGLNWWQPGIDENGKFKTKLRYAIEMIPQWADREHENLSAMIIKYPVVVYEPNGKKTIHKVEYWDLEGIRYFVPKGSNLVEDVEMIDENMIIKKDNEGNTICCHFILNNKKCLWEKLPFIYWKYNDDEKPLIHYLKSLVDCYDKLTSAVADTIEDTPNAVKVIKNYSGKAEDVSENLNTFGLMLVHGDGDFKYENPQINIEAFKVFIEQLRKDIYEAGFGVDTESDKFGNQPSGVAIQELYEDLDLDCSNIETEFQASLEYYKYFIDTYLLLTTGKDYTDIELEFTFNKSMIIDESEKITNFKNSTGGISKKTQLANHPWVKDIEAEERQMEIEQKEDNQYNNIIPNQKVNTNKDGDADEE